jgi:hypothetical protein
MQKDGKDLQRLIRVIESAQAAGTDIKIESPKFFHDKVTGQKREHDVVLTVKHAHHELVVALECRDRSRPVGIDSVEAFQTKCRDTGINSGIIVSSKGFYKTARKKAKHYGIRCLTLDEVAAFDWFAAGDLCIYSREITSTRLYIEFEKQFVLQMSDILDQTGQPITNHSINRTAENALNKYVDKLPKDLGSYVVRYTVEPNLSAVVNGISYKATHASLTIEFANRETYAPFQFRTYHDNDTDTQISQVAVANVAIGNFKADFVASTDSEGAILLSVVPTPAS